MSGYSYKSLFSILTVTAVITLAGCSGSSKSTNTLSMSYNSFTRIIEIPQPNAEQIEKFNAELKGDKKDLKKPSGQTISGFVTSNKEFLEEVIKPVLLPHIDQLKQMPKHQMINALALFGHEIFQIYFGKDFYRWGGDILDLDDPQHEKHRFDGRYGLDCSGYATFSYEMAVYFGLLDAQDFSALFSSKGFEVYCSKNHIEDKGGLDGGGNNFRLDTREIFQLGREIFRVEKGNSPTDEQVKMLQAGDLVGRSGHVGTIVEINGEPFYLESGGWVVPRTGYNPYHAKEAIAMFAKNGHVEIRRSLPDKNAMVQ